MDATGDEDDAGDWLERELTAIMDDSEELCLFLADEAARDRLESTLDVLVPPPYLDKYLFGFLFATVVYLLRLR